MIEYIQALCKYSASPQRNENSYKLQNNLEDNDTRERKLIDSLKEKILSYTILLVSKLQLQQYIKVVYLCKHV